MSKVRLLTVAAGIAVASAFLFTAFLQADEKPKYLFWSAAEMDALEKKMYTSMDATKGSHVDLMPTDHSYFMVFHREATAPNAEVHEKHGDFGFVRTGEGVILTASKLLNGKQSAAHELRGKIEGGTEHRLVAGDAFYIPANMPHQMVVEPGKKFTVEMLKVEQKDGFKDLPDFQRWDAAKLLGTEKQLKTKMNEYYSSVEDFIKNENTEFHMNHKEGTAESEIHDHWAEFQIIRNGEGTMMLGGQVVDAKVTGPGETRGTSLAGATAQPLRAGDLLYIPARMPHHTNVDRTKSQDKLILKVWVP